MSAYTAVAHIDRVAPRLVIGRSPDPDVDARLLPAADVEEFVADVAAIDDDDPLAGRLEAVMERWSQLTFFLFDAESWRR